MAYKTAHTNYGLIENCDFSALATPIGSNVTQAPVRYAVSNTKV